MATFLVVYMQCKVNC